MLLGSQESLKEAIHLLPGFRRGAVSFSLGHRDAILVAQQVVNGDRVIQGDPMVERVLGAAGKPGTGAGPSRRAVRAGRDLPRQGACRRRFAGYPGRAGRPCASCPVRSRGTRRPTSWRWSPLRSRRCPGRTRQRKRTSHTGMRRTWPTCRRKNGPSRRCGRHPPAAGPPADCSHWLHSTPGTRSAGWCRRTPACGW